MKFSQQRRKFLGGLAGAAFASAWPGFVLAETSGGAVAFLRPKDDGYDEHTYLFNKCIAKRPALVAVCMNEEGVRLAVDAPEARGCPLRSRAGGTVSRGFRSTTAAL